MQQLRQSTFLSSAQISVGLPCSRSRNEKLEKEQKAKGLKRYCVVWKISFEKGKLRVTSNEFQLL